MERAVWDEALLEELCRAMADASICGLGQAAPNPIRSVLKFFSDDLRIGNQELPVRDDPVKRW
jgi:formate dehydrogenase